MPQRCSSIDVLITINMLNEIKEKLTRVSSIWVAGKDLNYEDSLKIVNKIIKSLDYLNDHVNDAESLEMDSFEHSSCLFSRRVTQRDGEYGCYSCPFFSYIKTYVDWSNSCESNYRCLLKFFIETNFTGIYTLKKEYTPKQIKMFIQSYLRYIYTNCKNTRRLIGEK